MVESFMAFYFNYFHFYTMLWNIYGPVSIETSVHFATRRHIWRFLKFKAILSPSQDPKKLNNFDFIGLNLKSKMFVMVLKKSL